MGNPISLTSHKALLRAKELEMGFSAGRARTWAHLCISAISFISSYFPFRYIYTNFYSPLVIGPLGCSCERAIVFRPAHCAIRIITGPSQHELQFLVPISINAFSFLRIFIFLFSLFFLSSFNLLIPPFFIYSRENHTELKLYISYKL